MAAHYNASDYRPLTNKVLLQICKQREIKLKEAKTKSEYVTKLENQDILIDKGKLTPS